MGLFGPRGMPADLRERVAADLASVLDPLIRDPLNQPARSSIRRGPAEFAAAIEDQTDKLAAIAKVLNIKPAQ